MSYTNKKQRIDIKGKNIFRNGENYFTTQPFIDDDDDEELAKAISLSNQQISTPIQPSPISNIIKEQNMEYDQALKTEQDKEDENLVQKAIELSKKYELQERVTRICQSLNSVSSHSIDPSNPLCEIAVRMPNGTRLTRKFYLKDKIEKLRIWIEYEGLQCDINFPYNFIICLSSPAKILDNPQFTFQDYELFPRVLLNVSLP